MQELKTKEVRQLDEAAVRTVRVFLQTTFYALNGNWHWELETDAVFCSNVMLQFPADFMGTKAIFHPDDLAAVSERLSTQQQIGYLQFRIITTYGEIKTLAGENITVRTEEQTAEDLQQQAIEAVIHEQEEKAAAKHADLLKELAEKNSRFTGSGTWYFNATTGQTWYANAVFRLHGLPPQSLNAHLHTFHPFIHPEDAVFVTDFLDKAFRERTPLHMDYRILAGQTEKWIGYKADWFYSAQGEAILGGIFQDVTEQKAAERELEGYKNLVQFQRQQLQYDGQQVNFGHWQVNLLTRKTIYSDQYYRIFGLKPQSLSPTVNSFLNYIHPEDRDEVEAAYKKMLYEHVAPELEYRVLRADGKTRYVQQKAKLFLYEGELVISGLVQDITVQRMLEKKLASVQDESWLQKRIAEQSADMASLVSWSMDIAEGDITWSESFYKLLGYHKTLPSNITEKTLFSLIHPHDAKVFREHWTKALREKQPASFEFRIMQRGAVNYMKAVFSLHEHDERTYFVGTMHDRTAEQLLQQKLTQRVQLAESLTENIPDRIIITDTSNNILVWNPAAEKAYGIKKADAIGENFFDVFPALKTEEEMQAFHRVQRGEKVVRHEIASLTGNGYYNLYLLPLYSGSEVTGMLHVVHNVTAEMDLRKSLADRLQLIESLVQSSVDRIIALDRNMNYLYWNKKAEAYYGLSKEEVLGKNILEVFPQLVNDPSYAEIRKALKGETIHIPANPSIQKYFETYLVPIKNEKEEVVGLLWMAHDLANEYRLLEEQQKAKEVLKKEHQRLKEAQAVGHVGSFEWDARTDKFYWSDEMFRIHGMEPQSREMTPEKVLTFVHPDDQAILAALMNMRTTAGRVEITHRIVRPDGAIRTICKQIQSFAGEDGIVTHFAGTAQDITDQKKAEEIIKEQSHFLQRITTTVPDMISIMELKTRRFMFLNAETFGANGFDAAEMANRTAEENELIVHPDDRKKLDRYFQRFADAPDDEILSAEYRARTKDGEWKWFLVRGKVFQRDGEKNATHILNAIENITARKGTEQELEKNLAILKQAEELAQMGSWEYDIGTGAFCWSDSMYALFGLPKGMPVKPETYLDFVVEEDRAIAKRLVKYLTKTPQPFEEMLRIRKANGEVQLLRIKSSVVYDENGVPQKTVGVDLDITGMKDAEQKVAETRHWLEQTAQASPDAICVYDLQKKEPVYLNNCLSEWTGVSNEELVAMGIEGRLQLVHPDDRLPLLHFTQKMAMAKDGDVLTLEYRLQSKEDNSHWIRNRSKIFQRDASGKVTHILSFLQEISEEKAGERLLRSLNTSLEKQNRELEAKNDEITSFAFVASHDLKEPIRKIHTFSDWLLEREKNISESGRQNLTRLHNAVKRLDTLVEDIVSLTKVHIEDEDLQEISLTAVLQRAGQELQEVIDRSGAEIIAAPLPTVKGVENHLVYLFKNLLSNSIKFQKPDNKPVIRIAASEMEGFVKLTITDNGIGFAPEYNKRIFQMFRRLHGKSEFEGTGMGLAICKRIMEKHGGNITAEGEPGKGATFTCWFAV